MSHSPGYHQRRAHQREDHLWKENLKLSQRADEIRYGIRAKVQAEVERWQKAAAAAAAEVDREAEREVARVLKTPTRQWAGGYDADARRAGRPPRALTVRHWRVPVPGSDALDGPLLSIARGQIMTAIARIRETRPSLLDGDDGRRFEQAHREALREVRDRYRALPKLVDNAWSAKFFSDAKLTASSTQTVSADAGFSPVDRQNTVEHVPELLAARVTPDGLELVYRHRGGDSASAWQPKLSMLRAAFKSIGFNASNLSVREDADGNIVLAFDDAPSHFPKAVCLDPPTVVVSNEAEAIKRYDGTAWMLGLDARGNLLSYPVADFPHVLVVGGTGAGKSVWARSVIESLRTGYRNPKNGKDVGGGGTWFISSGKVSDFAALTECPGVAMVAGDAAQAAVMTRMVRNEAQRRFDAAAAAKRAGDTHAFDFAPIFLLLDEWGATAMELSSNYKKVKPFEDDINWILRLGREARVHVVLLSQTIRKTGAGAIPGDWQANLGLKVSLGFPESETFNNLFAGDVLERAQLVARRVKGHRGRGMAVDENGQIVEFQSFYVWSPGTTSLAEDADAKVKPPTDEVRQQWQAWQPVSAATPALLPRFGIKAEDGDWSSGDDLDAVANTPTVPLTNRDGSAKADADIYDPWSPAWRGIKRAKASGGGLGWGDEPAPEPEPTAGPQATPQSETTAEPQAEDDGDTKLAVLRIAVEKGLVSPEDAAQLAEELGADAEPQAEPKPQPQAEPKPQPKPKRSPRRELPDV